MSDQELNIKLVEAVEKHAVLYNYKLPGYSRKEVTEKAWKEVSVELDMPVHDCRDKWKNLRTVFMRKMKPSPSGGKKKAYYLENAMQFCLPFIKTVTPSSTGNLLTPPSTTQTSIFDTEGSATQDKDPTQLEDESTNVSQYFLLRSSSMIDESPQHQSEASPSSSKRTFQITKEKNIRSASQAEQSIAEYFKTKKALLLNDTADTSNPKIERQQSIKMFLLSLIPELEALSDSQIKLFKRQVLKVIDDISPSSTLTSP